MDESMREQERLAFLGLIASIEQMIACARESLEAKKAKWLRTGLHPDYCRYIALRVSLADMLLDLRSYVQQLRRLEAAT